MNPHQRMVETLGYLIHGKCWAWGLAQRKRHCLGRFLVIIIGHTHCRPSCATRLPHLTSCCPQSHLTGYNFHFQPTGRRGRRPSDLQQMSRWVRRWQIWVSSSGLSDASTLPPCYSRYDPRTRSTGHHLGPGLWLTWVCGTNSPSISPPRLHHAPGFSDRFEGQV